jgi:hypothetical protein
VDRATLKKIQETREKKQSNIINKRRFGQKIVVMDKYKIRVFTKKEIEDLLLITFFSLLASFITPLILLNSF